MEVIVFKRKTRDLCQQDWQDRHLGEYAPDTIRYGTCAECGESGTLVYRSRIVDETPCDCGKGEYCPQYGSAFTRG